jgi:hypothetical protein
MPSGLAMPTIDFVIWISAVEGVGSPEGWLCTNILSEDIALNQKAFLLSQEIAGVWVWGR